MEGVPSLCVPAVVDVCPVPLVGVVVVVLPVVTLAVVSPVPLVGVLIVVLPVVTLAVVSPVPLVGVVIVVLPVVTLAVDDRVVPLGVVVPVVVVGKVVETMQPSTRIQVALLSSHEHLVHASGDHSSPGCKYI